MNELQKKVLNLFCCFKDVCEKLNIPYFLVCGSVLGAARHEGFIPWDDDFDVGMYRDDYNKFMEQAPALLPEGIFLQNYKTDPAYPGIYAKLRDSGTTFVEKPFLNLDMNHGVYLDVFPLDGYPEDPAKQKQLAKKKKQYKRQLTCALHMPSNLSLKGKLSVAYFRMLGCHKRTAKILEKFEALISQYPVSESKIICNHGTWYGERDYIAKDYYGKGTTAVYEGLTVRVPEKTNDYLVALYGDWRTPPPPEKQKGTHDCEVCDTEKPYTDYAHRYLHVK